MTHFLGLLGVGFGVLAGQIVQGLVASALAQRGQIIMGLFTSRGYDFINTSHWYACHMGPVC